MSREFGRDVLNPWGCSKSLCKKKFVLIVRPHRLGAQYDWTTGVPDHGNEWRKFRAVPRLHPFRPVCFDFD